MYNTFAVIHRLDVPLSPATQELTRLALELLLSKPGFDQDAT